MSDRQHGLWIVAGEGRAQKIHDAIRARDEFTQAVDRSAIRPRPTELAIVSLSGDTADYLAISTKGRLVATDQITIAVSNLVPLGPISLEQLSDALPSRFSRRLPEALSVTWRPGPALWKHLLEAVGRTGSAVQDGLPLLRRLVAAASVPLRRRDGGLDVFERDAVATVLQVWGGVGYRKRLLRGAAPADNEVAPFLSRLHEVSIREDPQIGHDHVTFPGMEVARRYQVGAVVLANGGERLTILNCNRLPLEETLGVDLIYYNHRFNSFVLVQYKRMTARGGRVPVYRPTGDASHQLELDRMQATSRAIAALPKPKRTELDQLRLSAKPFYFKLCEAKAKAALDVGMVSGMYVPLGVWVRLLKSRAARGKRGGVAIGWHNCRRRFTNSEFTALLRNGWIGSSGNASDLLATVIEEVLGKGHMLVLAATSGGFPSRDYRRNTIGQFTADDDPLGSL